MPRRAKGPRLYFRTGRVDSKTGRALPDVWVIRDGQSQISTGCPYDGLSGAGGAEDQLSAYIARKWSPEAGEQTRSRRDPAQVGIAEVLTLYAMERAPELAADPVSTAGFIKHLAAWWGEKYVADIKRSTCKDYVAWRTSQVTAGAAKRVKPISAQTARRELETLSAAVGYWHGEDTLSSRPKVWLPEKPESPREALTRAQAARLLMAARGYRLDPLGAVHPSGRPKWVRLRDSGPANRAHLKRVIVLGYYVGSRPSVNLALLWEESPIQAWVDLGDATIYRRGRRERDHANKRRPLVRIPPRLLAHMLRWREIDRRRSEGREHPINSVIHHGGIPIGTKINKGFAAVVRDAGLPPEVTPHWLRHSCATWLMEAGENIWDAAGFMGMTTAVLEKHYGHHRPDHQRGVANRAGKGR